MYNDDDAAQDMNRQINRIESAVLHLTSHHPKPALAFKHPKNGSS